MNITVIIMTLLFILFTGPGAVVSLFYNSLKRTYPGKVVLFFGDSLQFSYHALNFVIVLLTNKKFSNIFFKLVVSKKDLYTDRSGKSLGKV